MHHFDQLCLSKSTCCGTASLYATLPVGCLWAAFVLHMACLWAAVGCVWAAYGLPGLPMDPSCAAYMCCICATYGLPLGCLWVPYVLHMCCIWAAYGLPLGCVCVAYVAACGLRACCIWHVRSSKWCIWVRESQVCWRKLCITCPQNLLFWYAHVSNFLHFGDTKLTYQWEFVWSYEQISTKSSRTPKKTLNLLKIDLNLLEKIK